MFGGSWHSPALAGGLCTPKEMLPSSEGTMSLALYEAPSPVPAGTATTPSQSDLARFLLLPLALMID